MTTADLQIATDYPVDASLPLLLAALTENSAVILQAPPGAGKTTRVPLALFKLPTLTGKSILMLEPRRLAAVNAAFFMARQLGEKVGESIGYTVRYERRVSSATRIEVVTEGVLTQRLQSDPELHGVGLVIFDEFHERNLQSDLALALCRDAQQGLRPDLKLVIMSATLETDQLSRLLDCAPVISSAGQLYPVLTTFADLDYDFQSLWSAVVATVCRALQETEGDILVFLPGAAEIQKTVAALRKAHPAIDIAPLYGGLSLSDQRRAIEPGQRRKVVVATNVAETSLTIEGVRSIVDSGLERRPRFDAARGLTTLETVRISQASARQREGRAGRLGPGRCYRLWSEGVHGSLLPQSPPEITQADLAPLALDLAHWGVADTKSLVWLDPPPVGHLAAARSLLCQLSALDDRQQLTAIGKKLVEIPSHPRLGRLLLQAQIEGCPQLGSDLIALLDTGALRGETTDLIASLHQIRTDPILAPNLLRAVQFWRKRLNCIEHQDEISERSIASLLAVAYPDRIARIRQGDPLHYLLANGMAATLDSGSQYRGCEFLIVVDLHGHTRSEVKINLAVRFNRDDFERIFGREIGWEHQVEWDAKRKQVVARDVRSYGALTLQSRPAKADPDDIRSALLAWVVNNGLELLPWSKEAEQLRDRLRFVAALPFVKEWPDFSDAGLLSDLSGWLGPSLEDVRSVELLRRVNLKSALLSRLDWQKREELDALAPERIRVPGGSNVRIDYSAAQPVLAVKLQELFGLVDSPRIAKGRVPVLIHLLSPAGRPLQVTADLKSFWTNIYPEVKKEMKGRYPKHPWSDDPWSAEPTRRTTRR
ncbi:MAG: ATP-dependent helicase HrpB [Desulfuromonadales bacterium]|nr:ATP-dependent helicase HrpB [Desulfuromonadales bacterium]